MGFFQENYDFYQEDITKYILEYLKLSKSK